MYSICTWFHYCRLDPDFHFCWRKRWCEFHGPRLLLRRFKDFDQVQRLGNRHAIPGTRKPTSFKWMEMVQQPEKLFGFAQLGISAGCLVFFFKTIFCVWNVQISLHFFLEFVSDSLLIHRHFAFRLRLACLLSDGTRLYVNVRSTLWTPFPAWKDEGFKF